MHSTLVLLLFSWFGSDDLLERTQAAHRAAIASLQSFSCKVELHTQAFLPEPRETRKQGAFWYAHGKVRCREVRIDGSDLIHIVDGETAKSWGTDGGKAMAAMVIPARDFVSQSNVFDLCLIEFFLGPVDRRLTLDELIQGASKGATAQRVKHAGRDLILITAEFAEKPSTGGLPQQAVRMEVYLDPAVNCLVRKIVKTLNDGKTVMEREITEFAEPSPGVFFPVKVEAKTATDGKPVQTVSITLSDLKVNQPIGAEWFEFRVPHGTKVFNRATMTSYESDERGNPISATNPIRDMAPGQTIMPIYPGKTHTGKPSASEEPDRWPWLLYAAVGLTGLGGVIWLWGSWRSRPAEG